MVVVGMERGAPKPTNQNRPIFFTVRNLVSLCFFCRRRRRRVRLACRLDQVNKTVQKVQEAVCHYNATLRQFIVDDKGTVAIVVFGLPPIYHEVRIVLCSTW